MTDATPVPLSRPLHALLIALAGSLLIGDGAASAATPEPAPAIVLHYDNSLLSSDAGLRTLYRRLNAAAERVCVDVGVSRFASAAALDCRRAAVERAIRQIDNPHLAALNDARSHRG